MDVAIGPVEYPVYVRNKRVGAILHREDDYILDDAAFEWFGFRVRGDSLDGMVRHLEVTLKLYFKEES